LTLIRFVLLCQVRGTLTTTKATLGGETRKSWSQKGAAQYKSNVRKGRKKKDRVNKGGHRNKQCYHNLITKEIVGTNFNEKDAGGMVMGQQKNPIEPEG